MSDENGIDPMSTIPIDLSRHLSNRTVQTLLRLGDEFGLDVESNLGLAYLVHLMRHIKETSYNFPNGKYTTIMACEAILADIAQRHVATLYDRRV